MGLEPVVFTATGLIPRLIEVSGNNQLAEPGQVLPLPLVVRLEDQFGNPLVGETVMAAVTAGEAQFPSLGTTRAEALTDEQGTASFALQLEDDASGSVFVAVSALNAEPVQFIASISFALTPRGWGIAVETADAREGSFVVLDQLRLVGALVRVPGHGDAITVSGCDDESCSRVVGAGPAFESPQGIAVEAAGSFVVTDFNGDKAAVLRVDPNTGQRTIVSQCSDVDPSTGECGDTTFGGGPPFVFPRGIAVEAAGSFVVVAAHAEAVLRVDPNTGQRTIVSQCSDVDPSTGECGDTTFGGGPPFVFPRGIAVEAAGSLVVAESLDTDRPDILYPVVLQVDQNTGERTIVSGCRDVDIHRDECRDPRVGEGPPFIDLTGIAIENENSFLVVDLGRMAVVRVDRRSGNRKIVSGCLSNTGCSDSSDSRGSGPAFFLPDAIAVEATGFLVVADAGLTAVMRVHPITGNRRIVYFEGRSIP